jgi:hypothetical protein
LVKLPSHDYFTGERIILTNSLRIIVFTKTDRTLGVKSHLVPSLMSLNLLSTNLKADTKETAIFHHLKDRSQLSYCPLKVFYTYTTIVTP